jgi:hypothetical protein
MLTDQHKQALQQRSVNTIDSDRGAVETLNSAVMKSVLGHIQLDQGISLTALDGAQPDFEKMDAGTAEALLAQSYSEGNEAVHVVQMLASSLKSIDPTMSDDAIGAKVHAHLKDRRFNMYMFNGRPFGVVDVGGHLGPPLNDVNEWTNGATSAPLKPEVRAAIGRAMGYSNTEIPETMAGWYQKEYPQVFVSGPPSQWDFSAAVSPAGSAPLSRSWTALGGMPVQPVNPDSGIPISPILSRFDATIQNPDGSTTFIPRGTPISNLSFQGVSAPAMLPKRQAPTGPSAFGQMRIP